jgi:hypothetical protein
MIILSSFVETIVIYFQSFIINFCCRRSSACLFPTDEIKHHENGGFGVKGR